MLGVRPSSWASKKCSRRHVLPGQNPFVERVIGSLRRECLDNHVIVWNERPLRRHLVYSHEWRTHLSLDKDAPVSQLVHRQPAARSFQSRTWVACIITTSVARLDRRYRHLALPPVVRLFPPHTQRPRSLAFPERAFPSPTLMAHQCKL
jgi:hypothetical protein